MKSSKQNCKANPEPPRIILQTSKKSRPNKSIVAFTLCIILSSLYGYNSKAQTLFSYGNHSVDKQEFLDAYTKSNSDSASSKISYNDYLELYLRFKLKVQEAKDLKMDTLAEQKNEVQSYRDQLAESFLKEDASINLLVDEAFNRSLKDLHLSHYYIPLPEGAGEEVRSNAKKTLEQLYARLQKGEQPQQDSTKWQYGSLGYITAFVLPYTFESIAYSTPVGQYSQPFPSASGYHILKVDSERKAMGKIRIAQIRLSFPPDATPAIMEAIRLRADSIHQAIQSGADFGKLAEQFSEDQLTFQVNGEMPAFGIGQYDSTFENAAFSIQEDGDISQPIKTSFGYHILKRLQRIPVIEDKNNSAWKSVLKERVLQSDRMQVAREMLVKNVRQTISKDAPPEILSSDSTVMNYYRAHLDKYQPDFAAQMKEFSEGNLLFGIMQKKIWDAAVDDSSALKKYYTDNKNKYYWGNSADALIITCLDPMQVEETRALAQNNIKDWRQWTEASNGVIQADSGRFELGQIPVIDRTNFTEGLLTASVINGQDSSRTFAYIIKMYSGKDAKSFNDARGAVINDYQNYLEERWIADLKRKYPVRINKKVLKKLPAR